MACAHEFDYSIVGLTEQFVAHFEMEGSWHTGIQIAKDPLYLHTNTYYSLVNQTHPQRAESKTQKNPTVANRLQFLVNTYMYISQSCTVHVYTLTYFFLCCKYGTQCCHVLIGRIRTAFYHLHNARTQYTCT